MCLFSVIVETCGEGGGEGEWANGRKRLLKICSVSPQISNLSADMKDGLILIALMEQLRGSEINRR